MPEPRSQERNQFQRNRKPAGQVHQRPWPPYIKGVGEDGKSPTASAESKALGYGAGVHIKITTMDGLKPTPDRPPHTAGDLQYENGRRKYPHFKRDSYTPPAKQYRSSLPSKQIEETTPTKNIFEPDRGFDQPIPPLSAPTPFTPGPKFKRRTSQTNDKPSESATPSVHSEDQLHEGKMQSSQDKASCRRPTRRGPNTRNSIQSKPGGHSENQNEKILHPSNGEILKETPITPAVASAKRPFNNGRPHQRFEGPEQRSYNPQPHNHSKWHSKPEADSRRPPSRPRNMNQSRPRRDNESQSTSWSQNDIDVGIIWNPDFYMKAKSDPLPTASETEASSSFDTEAPKSPTQRRIDRYSPRSPSRDHQTRNIPQLRQEHSTESELGINNLSPRHCPQPHQDPTQEASAPLADVWPLTKSLCKHMLMFGSCEQGDSCLHLHSADQLLPKPGPEQLIPHIALRHNSTKQRKTAIHNEHPPDLDAMGAFIRVQLARAKTDGELASRELCPRFKPGDFHDGESCPNLHRTPDGTDPPLSESNTSFGTLCSNYRTPTPASMNSNAVEEWDEVYGNTRRPLQSAKLGPMSNLGKSSIEVTPRDLCRDNLRGYCHRGELCMYRHLDSGPPQTFGIPHDCIETGVLASTKVILGPGAEVRQITTGYESRQVVISNLPPDVNEVDLAPLLGPLEGVPTIKRSKNSEMMVIAHFPDHVRAAKAVNRLHHSTFRGTTIKAILDLHQQRPSQEGKLFNTTVRVKLHRPSTAVRLYYRNSQALSRATDRLQADLHNGRRLIVMPGKPGYCQVTTLSVLVKGLSHDVNLDSFAKSCGAHNYTVVSQPYDIPHALASLRNQAVTCGIVEEFYGGDPSSESQFLHIRVRYSTVEAARKAIALLDNQPQSYLNGSKTHAQILQVVAYTLHRRRYRALRHEINYISQYTDPDIVISVTEAGDKVTIRLSTTRADLLVRYKSRLRRVLEGEVVKRDGQPVWDPQFLMSQGDAFFSKVNSQLEIFALRDSRKRTVTLYGPSESIARARADILEEADRLRTQRHTFTISRTSCRYFIHRGMSSLHEKLGPDNASLDISSCTITVLGGLEATRAADAEIKLSILNGTLPCNRDETPCPICLGPLEDFHELSCGHAYCTPCLSFMLQSATTTRKFPVVCVADDGKCGHPISLSFFREFLNSPQRAKLTDSAFRAYMQSHTQEYHFCPTPDCPEIYREQPDGTILQCPSCASHICASCHTESHDPSSCAENRVNSRPEDRAFEEWKRRNNVKSCPQCRAPLEKAGGCNHITCTMCNTHMCWVCMKAFKTTKSVYDHMRAVHGGIYPTDVEPIPEEDRFVEDDHDALDDWDTDSEYEPDPVDPDCYYDVD